MDLQKAQVDVNKLQVDTSSMSTEALIMTLLGQIHLLEEERDNARLLAMRMRERLEYITKQNNEVLPAKEGTTSLKSNDEVNHGALTKLLREVSSNMVNDLQQIIMNEEQRQHNFKQLASSCGRVNTASNCGSDDHRGEFDLYKEHYEKLLEEAENEKASLRKRLKNQQDLVLDRDIKIKELTTKLAPSTQ